MRVLAIDTTSPRGSVAVAGEEGVVAEARVVTPDGHSRWILSTVETLLCGLGLEPAAVDAFAVTTGPGSFTGLRVGLASVQGLALAAGRPCVGLPTLDLVARSGIGHAASIVALVDAFRGEVFVRVYDGSGNARTDPRTTSLGEALCGLPGGTAFVGDAVAANRDRIAAEIEGAVFPETSGFLASELARAALRLVAAGRTVSAGELRPVYLRGAHIRPSRQ